MKAGKNNSTLSRREFFNYLLAILSVPAVIWWLYVGRRNEKMRRNDKPVLIGNEVPNGISFIGSVIVVNQDGNIYAYEAKCTHLGCRINKVDDDQLVCQCHGSRFASDGKPVKGPADKALAGLIVSRDESGNYIAHSK